jgi:DNA-binding SARP family transcriptional activator
VDVDFGLLGPLQMSVDGSLVTCLGTPKQRIVLAMLLMNRNRPVGMNELISAVWEHRRRPANTARANIHLYVSNLRSLLADAGLDKLTVLATVAPGYQLRVADSACDLGRFEQHTKAGAEAAAAGRFHEASDLLTVALAQWRGPVLDGLNHLQFVEEFAHQLARQKVQAYAARARAKIAIGGDNSVIDELEALIDDDPYNEPLWELLITAYYVAGHQNGALRACRKAKTALDEIGLDPNPRLRELETRILRQEQLDVGGQARDAGYELQTTLALGSVIATRMPQARLRDSVGLDYLLRKSVTRIGRHSDNDIVLDELTVSRQHAMIVYNGAEFVITDLNSDNGVEVQRRRVRGSADLGDGDQIRIGGHEFTFHECPPEATDIDPSASD